MSLASSLLIRLLVTTALLDATLHFRNRSASLLSSSMSGAGAGVEARNTIKIAHLQPNEPSIMHEPHVLRLCAADLKERNILPAQINLQLVGWRTGKRARAWIPPNCLHCRQFVDSTIFPTGDGNIVDFFASLFCCLIEFTQWSRAIASAASNMPPICTI